MKKFLILCAALFAASYSFACTAVVVAGKYTVSGRSMMIKVRDSDERDSDFHIFDGPQYKFVGNTAKARKERSAIRGTVAGYNTQGLCLASLTPGKGFSYDTLYNKRISGGKLIFRALGSCRNLAEFEQMCRNLLKQRLIIAHIAAIDAEGGAAVYEFGGHTFRKFDANDPEDAPQGWRAMTNFSFTGDPSLGAGQDRYDRACGIMSAMPRNADGKYLCTPVEFADSVCRSGILNPGNAKWILSEGYITRYRSALTTTFQAAAPGEDPSHTIMWVQMGSPYTTPLIPVVLASGMVPSYVARIEDGEGRYAAKGALVALSDKIAESEVFNKPGDGKRHYFNPTKALEMIGLSRKAEAAVSEMFFPLADDWRSGKITDEAFFSAYALQQPQYFEIYKKIFAEY